MMHTHNMGDQQNGLKCTKIDLAVYYTSVHIKLNH